MRQLTAEAQTILARVQYTAMVVGIVALVVCLVGAWFDPTPFYRAYLAAYLFFWGLGLGGMALLMVYYLTGGAWGFLVRRLLEAEMRTLPLLALLFVPIAWGIDSLYLWAQPEVVAGDPHLQGQQFYLNPPFFWGRAVLYFVLWIALAYGFSRWSWRQEARGTGSSLEAVRTFSGLGLVVYGVTLHFAAIDWSMSLQPVFPSTIWGPMTAAGQLLTALGLAVLGVAWLAPRRPMRDVVSLKGWTDLGNLLLAMLVIWAYMVWFQFMLVWIANLPEDVVWYQPMRRVGWLTVYWILSLFGFAVPFLLLLFRAVKQHRGRLAGTAALLLVTQLLYQYVLVMPPFPTEGLAQHWFDFVTPLGIGGLWLAYFLHTFRRWPLLARHDPNAERALHLRELDEEEAAREEAIAHG